MYFIISLCLNWHSAQRNYPQQGHFKIATLVNLTQLWFVPGMGEILNIGNLNLGNYHISFCNRDININNYWKGFLKIWLLEVTKVDTDDSIQFDTNSEWYLYYCQCKWTFSISHSLFIVDLKQFSAQMNSIFYEGSREAEGKLNQGQSCQRLGYKKTQGWVFTAVVTYSCVADKISPPPASMTDWCYCLTWPSQARAALENHPFSIFVNTIDKQCHLTADSQHTRTLNSKKLW